MENERSFVDNPQRMPYKAADMAREGRVRGEAAPEESRKLRLRTSVRSASERYGTDLERNRQLL